MCAINGFNFFSRELILAMNRITAHRGPDYTDCWLDDDVSFGHNRLSIIDLSSSASQPMCSHDGNLVIVFNGEIYNFLELKKELEPAHPFYTKSDTEVILAAYEKWGADCVKRFNGIFAFAIWDKEQKQLFLARDHVGVKPLYYFWDGRRFIFSSEIKAILEHDVPRILNKEAFNHYLRVLYVPEPLTMFEGILKMPPATYAILKDNKFSMRKYWDVVNDSSASDVSPREVIEKIRNKVYQAVSRQLISDRPVGVYLSGGIDSSVVLDSMSRIRKNIKTFSVGFDLNESEGRDKFNRDFYLAKKTAQHYGTDHHQILLRASGVVDFFDKAIWHMDEPISKPTAIAMMKIAQEAKKSVAVVLGGDGGDELFGGYDRYRWSLCSSYYHRVPVFLRRLFNDFQSLKKLNVAPGIDRYALFMFQKNGILSQVVSPRFLDNSTFGFFQKKYFSQLFPERFEDLMMEVDRKSWLVDDSLVLTDKMTMSSGLECRVPLVDKEVVEFVCPLSLKHKVNLFHTKVAFKEAFRGYIPDFLYKEPKRGWYAPGAKWLRRPDVFDMVNGVLNPLYYEEMAPLFRWDEVQKVLFNHMSKEVYNLTILWALLTFQVWARRFRVKI